MRKTCKKVLALTLACTMILSATGCGSASDSKKEAKTAKLDPNNPTTISIWNYYNGDQLTAFESLVNEFNDTVGAEKGILVQSTSQGSINNLADSLMDAVNGKTGAQDIPTMAAIYAETGYELQKKDALASLDDYFTDEDLSKYIPGFLEEGRLTVGGNLVLFPVSKSTECFIANATDWADFEAATGISIKSITSLEKLTAAAESYYNWTDSLTPDVAEDGKALYGRDSTANYVIIGTKQLGQEIFKVTSDGLTLNLDKDAFRKLWDNYYIPFINGYFTADASYRSEDMKTGNILAMTGSSSGVTYVPTNVTDADDQTHSTTLTISPQLQFENASDKVSVQQGAGYCVMKSSDEQQYAAVEFLKWFTDAERNLEFSVSSGYSPVTHDANNSDKISDLFSKKETTPKNVNLKTALQISADIFNNENTYTNKAFEGSKDARTALETAFNDACKTDRAAVKAAIDAGATREEAVAKYVTDDYFDQWFAALKANVSKITGK